ncbi:hypothetical protein GKC32_00630 [Lactobacillus curvatus]|nr:hypothetical protein [Latilactobacillus curvatus]MSE22980.1 hypothetical protein [Latilactobacillus curvatus]
MKIEEWSIDKVIPYENNPRNNEAAVEPTAQSIREFGWQQPIVVDNDGVIVVGHTRLKAAKLLGLEQVPVTVANLPDEKIRAYRIADNRTGELATWELDKLQEELNGIEDVDLNSLGFTDIELNDVDIPVTEDDYDGSVVENPTSKVGEIYQLGNHRLMCGDSTSIVDVEKLMGGQQANLLLTDPPYNIDYEGQTEDHLKIMNDSMESDTFRQFLVDAFVAAKNVMKSGAAFYIWHADTERYNFEGACRDIGWQLRQTLIWHKNMFTLGRQDYQWQHEPCLYGWNEGTHSWFTDRKQTTVLNFDKPVASELHPTMKPIPLFDYQIKNSTKSGDNVLDSFGGSGTTLMACEQNGRNAYLMELDPRYVDTIIKRWEEFTGNKAIKVN